MKHTLNLVENLQFEPITIPDYCLTEIYKDSITKENAIGFALFPITGKSNDEIKTMIAEKAESMKPEGYENKIILAGRTKEEFNHNIVYCVWYINDIPTYPAEPIIEPIGTPSEEVSPYENFVVENNGAINTYCELAFTITDFTEDIEFYVNDEYFVITPSIYYEGENVYVVNKDGVFYAHEPIHSFVFNNMPFLAPGINKIKVKTTNVSNIEINFNEKY